MAGIVVLLSARTATAAAVMFVLVFFGSHALLGVEKFRLLVVVVDEEDEEFRYARSAYMDTPVERGVNAYM